MLLHSLHERGSQGALAATAADGPANNDKLLVSLFGLSTETACFGWLFELSIATEIPEKKLLFPLSVHNYCVILYAEMWAQKHSLTYRNYHIYTFISAHIRHNNAA